MSYTETVFGSSSTRPRLCIAEAAGGSSLTCASGDRGQEGAEVGEANVPA